MVVHYFYLININNWPYLIYPSLCIFYHFFTRKLFTRNTFICWVSNSRGKVSDKKNYFVTKSAKFLQDHVVCGVTQMQCFSCCVSADINFQLLPRQKNFCQSIF